MSTDFTWRDAGRTVVFRGGGVGAGVEVLREQGVEEYELLSTPRALAGAEALAAAASAVHEVKSGQVPAAAAALLDALVPPSHAEEGVRVRPLVALGGGRVIDVAKAVASVSGAAVVAVPTTMSGAEMTGSHRLPEGSEGRVRGMVRPGLVIADPEAMTSQPEEQLRASSMNALAHGADTLYLPLSNPVSEMTALRGAALIARSLDSEPPLRSPEDLALGSLFCAYAIDSAGMGMHHLVCQSLVRFCGTPHAETNAAVLPCSLAFLSEQAPEQYGRLASALDTELLDLPERVKELGRPPGLGSVGGDRERLGDAVEAMLQRPELQRVPRPPTRGELFDLVERAW
ncbi:MAG TPA: iron-containing alcohol dehydrogenase [Solirubrobacterales bacterium]|nr:iron-containing alcohol dehydrogenase [Solirubrobacterales bacterium]